MLSAKHEHIRLLTSAATRVERPGNPGGAGLRAIDGAGGCRRHPKAALIRRRQEHYGGRERTQSRRCREGGERSRTGKPLVFKAATMCESGVAGAALPPQSKAIFGQHGSISIRAAARLHSPFTAFYRLSIGARGKQHSKN